MGVQEINHFLAISDQIGTSGQPTRGQFEDIKIAGYEVVVNLAMPDSENAIPEEGSLVTSKGMRYVHIPVVWQEPTLDDLSFFRDTMDSHTERKVFVHCVVNMRVSAFTFLYRVISLKVDPVEAKARMAEIWEPQGVWEMFVDEALQEHGVDYFDL